MQAIVAIGAGGLDFVQVHVPTPGPGQIHVLVKVETSSQNPTDCMLPYLLFVPQIYILYGDREDNYICL